MTNKTSSQYYQEGYRAGLAGNTYTNPYKNKDQEVQSREFLSGWSAAAQVMEKRKLGKV